jgi:hypothetical protein
LRLGGRLGLRNAGARGLRHVGHGRVGSLGCSLSGVSSSFENALERLVRLRPNRTDGGLRCRVHLREQHRRTALGVRQLLHCTVPHLAHPRAGVIRRITHGKVGLVPQVDHELARPLASAGQVAQRAVFDRRAQAG